MHFYGAIHATSSQRHVRESDRQSLRSCKKSDRSGRWQNGLLFQCACGRARRVGHLRCTRSECSGCDFWYCCSSQYLAQRATQAPAHAGRSGPSAAKGCSASQRIHAACQIGFYSKSWGGRHRPAAERSANRHRRWLRHVQRNLLYTGVTRGKRLVVLVGRKKAVAIAVRNASGRRRWSKLSEWLALKNIGAKSDCVFFL
jgi:hypothetical protein